MNKLISFLPIVLSLLLFHSCTSLKHVSYERLQAADVSYPEQVRRVGVVNFMPVVDTLSQPEYRLPYVSEGDGRVAIDQLAQEIAATNYFDEVVICDSAFRQDPSWTDGEIPEGLVERLSGVGSRCPLCFGAGTDRIEGRSPVCAGIHGYATCPRCRGHTFTLGICAGA